MLLKLITSKSIRRADYLTVRCLSSIKNYSSQGGSINRPVRLDPPTVRLGFIPEEFLQFFYKKTGVSGFATFCFTFGTYLVSKEYFVMEHEYYNGLSLFLLIILINKSFGKIIAAQLDRLVDDYERSWSQIRINLENSSKDGIVFEEKQQKAAEGEILLFAAKRENVHLQREAEYRQRLMTAYEETKKRLDYYVIREDIERSIAQRQIIYWVGENVKKSVTPDLQEQFLKKCLDDLKSLAAVYEKVQKP